MLSPRCPFAEILGLACPNDTIVGLNSERPGTVLELTNTTLADIHVDSIAVLPDTFSLVIGYHPASGGGWTVLAAGDSSNEKKYSSSVYSLDIGANSTLGFTDLRADICFCLVKARAENESSLTPLDLVFYCGNNSDTVHILIDLSLPTRIASSELSLRRATSSKLHGRYFNAIGRAVPLTNTDKTGRASGIVVNSDATSLVVGHFGERYNHALPR